MRSLVFLVLVSCGTTATVTQVNVLPFSPYERRIDVLLTPPTRPHVDRDLIRVSAGLSGASDAELMTALRLRAESNGCDAVAFVGMVGRYTVLGSCIMYSDRAPTAVP